MQLIVAETFTEEIGLNLNVKGGMICAITSSGATWTDYSIDFTSPQSNIISLSLASDASKVNCKLDASQKGFYADSSETTTCCPIGYVCTDIAGGGSYCKFNAKIYCSDFNESEDVCKAAGFPIANRTMVEIKNAICGFNPNVHYKDDGKYCYNMTACSCVWNSAANGGKGSCDTKEVNNETCYSGETQASQEVDTCNWQLVTWEDLCSTEGYINAKWVGTGDCDEQEKIKTIDCENIVKLDFFDELRFFVAGISIALIYLVYIARNKKSCEKE